MNQFLEIPLVSSDQFLKMFLLRRSNILHPNFVQFLQLRAEILDVFPIVVKDSTVGYRAEVVLDIQVNPFAFRIVLKIEIGRIPIFNDVDLVAIYLNKILAFTYIIEMVIFIIDFKRYVDASGRSAVLEPVFEMIVGVIETISE